MQEKICVAFLLFLALATPADAAQLGRTTSQVNFREGPNRSARVISVLSPGTEVAILREDSGSWYQVTHHGRTGFVHKSYVDLQQLQNPPSRFDWKKNNLVRPVGIILASVGVVLMAYVWAPFLLTTASVLVGSLITVVVLDLCFQLGALYSLFSVSLGLLCVILWLVRKKKSRRPSRNEVSHITKKAA